jgi:hypothetical protein
MFTFDESSYTLEDMLTSNATDDAFCAWAVSAQIGDEFCGCVRTS